MTIQVKASEQSYPVGALYYAVQVALNFWVCIWNSTVWQFKWKLLRTDYLSNTFYLQLMLYKVVLPFESVYKSLNWDRSHENFSSIFSTVLFIFSVFQKQENWIVPEVLIIFGALIGVIWLWTSGRFSQLSCSAVKPLRMITDLIVF